MIASGALLGVNSLVNATPAAVAVVPAPSVVMVSQAPIASQPPVAVDPGIPSSAISALGQTARLNQRVVADAERLTAALAMADPSSAEIAPILRTMAASASFGARVAPTVGDWDQASAVSEDLAGFYAADDRRPPRRAWHRRSRATGPTRQPRRRCSRSWPASEPSTQRHERLPTRRISSCRR